MKNLSCYKSVISFAQKLPETMAYRWSFDISKWEPSINQLKKISEIIQPEEKERIARFLFISDAKSSLIGRLLIRKLVQLKTGVPNHTIKLGRDENNKPFLIYPDENSIDAQGDSAGDPFIPAENLNFNVSHQGSFAVLASDPQASLIGIDVMNVQKPGQISKSADEYFRLMNRQFTDNEWRQIKGLDSTVSLSDKQKMKNFTRFWCLKEAYVKGVGKGLGIELKTVDFQTKTELDFDAGRRLATDTTVKVNGSLEKWWLFEERFLDKNHIVTVGKQVPAGEDPNDNDAEIKEPPEFEEVTLSFLLENMTSLQPVDSEWVNKFVKKKKTRRVGDEAYYNV